MKQLNVSCGSISVLLVALLVATAGCSLTKMIHSSQTGQQPSRLAEESSKNEPSSSVGPTHDKTQLCIVTAQNLAKGGHATEAVALYERARASSAGCPPLDRELAPLYAQLGQWDRSLENYRSALNRTPDDRELLNNYAWTLVEAKRFEEADLVLKKALTTYPDDQRLGGTLAMLYARQGRQDLAFSQFSKLFGPAAAEHNMALLSSSEEAATSSVATKASPQPTAR